MRSATTCVAAALAAAIVMVPAEAFAQPRKGRAPKVAPAPLDPEAAEDAKLRAGIEAYEARDHKRAIAELERLYTSTKKPRALYWLGRAHQDAGQHASALRAFKRYLHEGGADVSEKRSVEVLGHVQTLTMQVAVVTVTAAAGAMIRVDDADIGEAPLAEPVYLDPGKHAITASGGASKTVDVNEETRLTIDLRGAKEPAAPMVATATIPAKEPKEAAKEPAPAPSTAPTSTKSSGGSNGVVTVAGLGVATLLAGGSVFFAVKAAGTSRDFDAKKGEAGATRNDLEDLQGQARLESGVALGLGVAAIATAGLTLFVFRKSDSRIVTTGNGFAVKGGF